ncbi:hypothetical protein BN946_scf185016.g64 [Trametes cinnabarina]|uniref:Uncharacterized protein n=1 Tax=Pycnoporus cinnabarinus TaxID=5643 RepID=A0A060SHC5_PYCCI|nr:hypothetical protein BN946_scf185016.g64 [Trametes cinnabarina]
MATKRPPMRRASSAMPALPPTPPRTTHKRKRRSRSRVTDSSSEEEVEHEVPVVDSDDEREGGEPQRKIGALVIGHKRRRMLTLDAIAEELSEATAEDAFWIGDSGAGVSSSRHGEAGSSESKPMHKVVKNRAPTRARSRTRSPSASPAPHLLRRGHTGLFSPPPSRRAPVIVPRPATPPPEPQRSKDKGKAPALPERDSPNNPFLSGDSPASVPPSEGPDSPLLRTPQKHVEKPTITYVFRGVKTVVANPHYRSPGAAAEVAEAEARARLPAEHPDYSPLEACEPKLLFPEARKAAGARRRAHTIVPPTSPTPRAPKRRAADSSGDEEPKPKATAATSTGHATRSKGKAPAAPVPVEDEEAAVLAAALAERVAKRMRKGIYADGEAPRTRPSSTAGSIDEEPKIPEKDRSDPIKRAMGPVRPRKA